MGTWRRRWWLAVAVGVLALPAVVLLAIGDPPGPTVVRVVADGPDLWVQTAQRSLGQGVDEGWHVSHDGGATWSSGRPAVALAAAAPTEQGCTAVACYRLVEGRTIERRVLDEADPAAGGWEREHQRASAPPPAGAPRSDWVEQRSLAATDAPRLDGAVVAAGHDGVLVRSADGTWAAVEVEQEWEVRNRWWIVGVAIALALLVGLGVDQVLRRTAPKETTGPTPF